MPTKQDLKKKRHIHPSIDRHASKFRKSLPPAGEFAERILQGDQTYLSRAITLTESKHPGHRALADEIIRQVLPHTGKSLRLGITGVPGAGKSTFIDRLGMAFIEKGHRVAVLAIDPTSSLNKGSILGDKTRMENLSRTDKAFIRPSPSGNFSGGVARSTRESILLCEAAGFDRILVETVGTGQSETYAWHLTDLLILLKIPAAGDELQGIKRGIMEMADLILINKADGALEQEAQRAVNMFGNALHYFTSRPNAETRVMAISSLENRGIQQVAGYLEQAYEKLRQTGRLEDKRKHQMAYWFNERIEELFRQMLNARPALAQYKKKLQEQVYRAQLTPHRAAELFWQKFLEESKG